MARSSGIRTIRGSASTSARSAATDGMVVFPAATAQHASAKAMMGRYNTLAGSCMAARALAPRRALPPTNQISVWASNTNSLAIGGVELPFAVPLSALEIFEGGGIAGVLPEGQETGRRLGPILGNQDEPDTPFRHIGRRLQQLDFSLLVKTLNDDGHGT